jgi:dTDP-4-dehydrorhamnose 3,5-epimerase-like enzyme
MLNDVVVLKRPKFNDERGYFSELLNLKNLQFNVVQLNLSHQKGVLSGAFISRNIPILRRNLFQ